MGITALAPPTRSHKSKYQFTEDDVKSAVEMLNKGEHPGQGGYEKEGQARSAASHLIEQCEAVKGAPQEIGSRAWKSEDDTWAFALKVGKRAPNPKKS